MLLTSEKAQAAVASYLPPACALGLIRAPSASDDAASDAITAVASCESLPEMMATTALLEVIRAPSASDDAASDAITAVASCESLPEMMATMAPLEVEQGAAQAQQQEAPQELGHGGGVGPQRQEAGGR